MQYQVSKKKKSDLKKNVGAENIRRLRRDNVQSLWRIYGWVPPTEYKKDFKSSLKKSYECQDFYPILKNRL